MEDEDDYQILDFDDIDFSGIDYDVLADLEVSGSGSSSPETVTTAIIFLLQLRLR